MTPREFYQRYGIPIVREIVADTVFREDVRQNYDRYLLVFLTSANDISFRPSGMLYGTGITYLLSANSEKTFTHALHGSLVNMAWEVQMVAGSDYAVIEGIMPTFNERITIPPPNGFLADPELIRRIREINQSRRV